MGEINQGLPPKEGGSAPGAEAEAEKKEGICGNV